MAISFSGLMLSAELVLNEFGFMLCLAVLIDTFVIRSLLVPALLALVGDRHWWPSNMPPPHKADLDVDDEDEDEVGAVDGVSRGVGHSSSMFK